MPRIRTLKPEALQHRKVGRLSDRAFRLWIGMILQADDHGRLVADPEQLRVLIFGYHPSVQVEDVVAAREELERVELIRVYGTDRLQYADFPSWRDHQRVDHARASQIPEFSEFRENSRSLANIREASRLARARRPDRKGSEGTGRDQGPEGIKDRTGMDGPTAVAGFARFWTVWPKRVGKGKAREAWGKKRCEPLTEKILAAVERQRGWLLREGGQFCPNPATWLSQERWDDEPPEASGLGSRTAGNVEAFRRAAERLRQEDQA